MPKKNAVCSPPLAMAERIFCPQRLTYTWREKKGRGEKPRGTGRCVLATEVVIMQMR